MSGTPFVLGITVYDTDGSTVVANVNVTIRNESTNETQTLTTNSSGEAVFNLADFTSGWTVGDIITYFVLYQGYEATASFTTTATGGTTQTLTLVAATTTPSLRYFTVQDFLDTFRLTTYDSDNENGVKPQTVVKVGQQIEENIDRILGEKFDSNSGSYYTVTDEYHNARRYQSVWFTKKTPIVTLKHFEVNTNPTASTENWEDLAYSQLDLCDATTDWNASTSGAVTLNTTNGEFNEGTGCLNVTKTAATQTSVTFSKTLSTAYDFTGRTFKLDFYCEDNTELKASGSTAIEIRVGSDSSNYYSKTFDKTDITQGAWNTLSLAYNSSESTASTTGTPDAENCDYIAIVITYAASTTTVTAGDMRLDYIRLNNPETLDIRKDIGRIQIAQDYTTLSSDFPEPGKDQVRITYTYGYSSVPSDIKRLAILMTGQSMNVNMIGRLNITTQEADTGIRLATESMIAEIDSIIQNRKMIGVHYV